MMKAYGTIFLILFKEINSVYCDKHTKHINNLPWISCRNSSCYKTWQDYMKLQQNSLRLPGVSGGKRQILCLSTTLIQPVVGEKFIAFNSLKYLYYIPIYLSLVFEEWIYESINIVFFFRVGVRFSLCDITLLGMVAE